MPLFVPALLAAVQDVVCTVSVIGIVQEWRSLSGQVSHLKRCPSNKIYATRSKATKRGNPRQRVSS